MSKFSTTEWVIHEQHIFEAMRSPDPKLREGAIRRYVRSYSCELLRVLSRHSIDQCLAEDIAQETFLTALAKLLQGEFVVQPERSSWNWLVTIGLNKVKTFHRARGRETERIRHWVAMEPEPSLTPDERALYKERLLCALVRLPPAQRVAIDKLLIIGLCGTNERTLLRANLSRALRNLTLLLSEEGSDEFKQTQR